MTLSVAWDSEIILSGSILDFDKSDMRTLHRDDGTNAKGALHCNREPQKESLYSCHACTRRVRLSQAQAISLLS
jgi:hypothetical protein